MAPNGQDLIDSLEAMWVHFRSLPWGIHVVVLGLVIGFVIVALSPG